MQTTLTVPNVPVAKFKRTKIVATIGPATNSYDQILALLKAGVNGMRLNFSHGTHEEHAQQVKWIREASKAYGKPVAIIQDLQGPKIRLGDFEGVVNVRAGQELTLKYQANYMATGHLPLQYDLSRKVKRGELLYLYDGKVKTVVNSTRDGVIHVTAQNDGILIKRKGINVPETDLEGDVITKKDREDLAFGSTLGVDYVAQSFVQTAADVRAMRRLMKNLNMDAKLIVKFETKTGLEHMEEIVREADMVMVARGDLAVEVPAESVPIIQRQLIGLGMRFATPTIVATQMLFSMTETSEPTRAEVSDVATAVLLGADAVMLSDETANGKYPVEAVKMMKRIILFTQMNAPLKMAFEHPENHSKQAAICDGIVKLAERVEAKAIVAETRSGATALQLAARRPERPIIAVTSDPRVANQIALAYGTKSYVRPNSRLAATRLTDWLQKNKVLSKGDMVVTASGRHPGVVGTTDTIKVRVLE